jgi:hypothetical protein
MTTTRSASCAISRFAVPRPGGRPAPVVARATELQRDPEHAGELLVPLGPSLHVTSTKPARRRVCAQSMRIRLGSCGSPRSRGCQLVSASRPPGRSRRSASWAAAAGSVAECSASIETTASAVASGRPVAAKSPTTNRARSAKPNSAVRSVACWTATAEKSTPTSTAPCDRASHSAGPPRLHPGRPGSCRVRGRGRRPGGRASRPRGTSTARFQGAGRGWLAATPAGSLESWPPRRIPCRSQRPSAAKLDDQRPECPGGPATPSLPAA